MIELTGEMLQVAHRALAANAVAPPGLVRALRDVLALVDRDYTTTRKPIQKEVAA